jgi:hypothetical protein
MALVEGYVLYVYIDRSIDFRESKIIKSKDQTSDPHTLLCLCQGDTLLKGLLVVGL